MLLPFLPRTGLAAKLVKFFYFGVEICLHWMIELPSLRETVFQKIGHCFQESTLSTSKMLDGRLRFTVVTIIGRYSIIRHVKIHRFAI